MDQRSLALECTGLVPRAAARPAEQGAVTAPVREFLTWVARCPRTYADAMDAWRSNCPRYTVWEDALGAELIQIAFGTGGIAESQVTLTALGQAAL